MSKEKTVILTDLILMHQTDRAMLVRRLDAPVEDKDWIPKGVCKNIIYGENLTDDETNMPAKMIQSVEVPEWVLKDKKLN